LEAQVNDNGLKEKIASLPKKLPIELCASDVLGCSVDYHQTSKDDARRQSGWLKNGHESQSHQETPHSVNFALTWLRAFA
jgi:hypothetical protein